MRSIRLDDVLLIEKLRGSQNEIQDALNEVIGVMTTFANHLDSLNQKDHLTDAL